MLACRLVTVREIRFTRLLIVSTRAAMSRCFGVVACPVIKMLGRFSVMVNGHGRHVHGSSEIALCA